MTRPRNPLSKLLLFPLGLTLALLAAFSQGGTALSAADPTPTPDRLAEPTLPANPSQADDGAQEFWFQCLPCHGDKGQGLTDEFRLLYPPEEQNCWESGCHGIRYYENGWTIPKIVPAVIGKNTLQKFPNALVLQAYIKASMPFQWPNTLDDETAWALTAFLLRENGLWQAKEPLSAENASGVAVSRIPPAPSASPLPTSSPLPSSPSPTPAPPPKNASPAGFALAGAALFLFSAFFLFRWLQKSFTETK